MGFFMALVIAVIVIAVNFGTKTGETGTAQGERKKEQLALGAEKTRAAAQKAGRAMRQGIRKAASSERAADKQRWAAAREKQDDAAQLHAVHMDSCESKLESIRILYEAGILDREEYEQRKARIRAKHNAV